MTNHTLRRSLKATAILAALGALMGSQVANAGPGIAPVYSANAAPYPAPPDTFANTYYANSPLGLRTDLVANPLNPIAAPTIDTGTALRKFVDILPGISALAPTTNIGTGTTGISSKYIPVASALKWADGADYYHIAVVEYTEQMHSDLPKGTVLRGYVQIEEPGQAQPAASKHIPLTYPNGAPIMLPNASGVPVQVYAYDNPHYLGPAIVATKGVATRVKYSNLLPVGDATGKDPWGNSLGNGVSNRNGDLPLPVDPTLPGGALPQNRVDIHMHGGFTPWISDGTPHQWTIPVGDTRWGYLSDIAVTATGSGYTAPVVTIDPPQSNASGLKAGVSNGSVQYIDIGNGGAYYANGVAATIGAPAASVNGVGTAVLGAGGAVSSIAVSNAGMNYTAAPSVSISAPTSVAAQGGTAVLATGHVSSVTLATPAVTGYVTAPTVTFSAPATAQAALGAVSATLNSGTGAITSGNVAVTTAGAGYATAPAVTLSAPAAAAVGAANLSAATASPTTGALSAATFAVSNGGWGYGNYTGSRVVNLPAPAAAVAATIGTLTYSATGGLATVPVSNAATNWGYGSATIGTITLATPTGAVANATVSNTQRTSIAWNTTGTKTITLNNGAGYNVLGFTPTVTQTGGVGGTATYTVNVSGTGAVSSITVNITKAFTTAPTGLTITAAPAKQAAQVRPTVTNNRLTGFTVVTAGSGYTTAPTITLPALPASVNATATVNIANNAVTGLTLTNAGTNYTAAPTAALTLPTPPASVTATATAAISGTYTVSGVTISGGTNYKAAPTVLSVGAPNATTATGTAVLATQTGTTAAYTGNGVNYGRTGTYTVTPTTAGSGYTAAPAVSLTGGFGGTATATATINTTTGAVSSIVVTVSRAYTRAPTLSVAAPATKTLSNVGSVTINNAGSGYAAAPTVTFSANAAPASATATVANGVITGFTITSAGYGYTTPPTVTVGAPATAAQATATGTVDANGTIVGFTITNPGLGYWSAPAVTAPANPVAIQATATATQSGGALTGVTITNIGRGYLSTPNVTVTDKSATATGGAINALVQSAVGVAFRQVPDMVGTSTVKDAAGVSYTVTAPVTGEGTLYYTNQQSERLMWYHDHASGITRLNVYEGLAAPYLLVDPSVDPAWPTGPLNPTGAGNGSALDTYVPREQIAMVIQDKTFVPKDIALQDQNWDQTHWGVNGDLWYPHVYETNQNPAFLHSLSNLGRWDWGPWFAIVYPSLYALPSGKYGDVTLTPEAYEDTAMINGTAYPELTVEPRAYRWRVLNATNDRFLSLGFFLADTTQPAVFTDTLHTSLGVMNYPEVEQFMPVGAQPQVAPGGTVTFVNQAGNSVTETVAPNVFQTQAAALTPWPMDGGAAGPGANHIVPAPSTMGPPIISIGNEGGLLPRWVQHDAVPVSYDYNRRSATVLNTSQNNDYTQQCFPECHGLYVGPAERSDFVVDFAPYAGKTLILYNDAPAPNPGYDTRIDYYTGNDPSGNLNYMTGGAPSTLPGYGPSTRTMMQVVVKATISTPLDYTKATKPMPAQYASWNPAAAGLTAWNPNALGGGAVLGVTQDASGANCQVPGAPAIAGGIGSTGAAANCVPGVIQQTYAATQGAPIVGESAYNIAFNSTTQAANAAKGIVSSAGNWSDEYGNMYLGSQNQPEFYVTNPGPLTLTALALTGQTSTTGAASGVGLGGSSTGTNVNAGSGTGYYAVPGVVIAPPTGCVPSTSTTQNNACVTATGHATIGDGGDPTLCGTGTLPACNNVPKGQVASVALDNAGAGYTEVPNVLIVSGGTLSAVSLTNAGSGYTPGAILPVTLTSSSGSGAAATATVGANGSVASITVTAPGTNYTTPPTISLPAPNAAGTGASATSTLSGNTVGSLALSGGGSGFTFAPAVQISAPTNIPATATATMDTTTGTTVASVAVSANGGYTTVPAVTFSAPPAAVPAVITPTYVSVGSTVYLVNWTISNPGSGYVPGSSLTVTDSVCGANATFSVSTTGVVTGSPVFNSIGGTCATTGDAITYSATPVAGTQATGTAVMDATGSIVTGVTVTNAGAGYLAAPTVSIAVPTPVQATATTTITNGVVTGLNLTNAGAGYSTAPTVTIAGAGGVQATAQAAVAGGGYGATAIAIASSTQVFIAPSALPGNMVPPTSNATPMTLTPAVASLLGCGNTSVTIGTAAVTCTNLSGAVVGRLMNPAIQELFEPFYGRMNATLGIEMPNQSLNVQTTLPLNYVDPSTELWEFNKPVMWKITHNGVDAHPVHIHLINAQLINRVGWDGTIKQPEDDEIGWKEVIKMNPLEDIILAMVPTQPPTPFGIDRSVRAQDPSQPLGVNMGFTQYSVEGFNGLVGKQATAAAAAITAKQATDNYGALVLPAVAQWDPVANPTGVSDTANFSPFFGYGSSFTTTAPAAGSISPLGVPSALGSTTNAAGALLVGVGDPATVVNAVESFDNEWVWHCHILGHEENDFMRAITTLSTPVVPAAPTALTVSQSATGTPVTISWTDPTPLTAAGTSGNLSNELGFLVQRSYDGGTTWTTVARAAANATAATDPVPVAKGQVAVYRVVGYNAAGLGTPGAVTYTGL